MRPKFIVSLFLSACLVVAMIALLKQHFSVLPPPKPEPAVMSPVTTNVEPPVAMFPVEPVLKSAPAVVKTLTAEDREAAVDAEKDRLYTWSMNDDVQSLSNILSDLTSPEKEIRMAAIEATKQFGSTNAIPTLKADAMTATDTEEQIAMLQAADFLSLPDMAITPNNGSQTPQTPQQIQAMAQAKAKAEARRQAYIQAHHPDQNLQSAPPANSPNTATGN